MKILFFSLSAILMIVVFPQTLMAQTTGAADSRPASLSVNITSGDVANSCRGLGALNQLYTLGLALVGISALGAVMYGGIQYIFARDSAGLVGSAKTRIRNALWGIFIAAFSYALLYTINPALVQFRVGNDTSNCQFK